MNQKQLLVLRAVNGSVCLFQGNRAFFFVGSESCGLAYRRLGLTRGQDQ